MLQVVGEIIFEFIRDVACYGVGRALRAMTGYDATPDGATEQLIGIIAIILGIVAVWWWLR